jgi:hypothetical protein
MAMDQDLLDINRLLNSFKKLNIEDQEYLMKKLQRVMDNPVPQESVEESDTPIADAMEAEAANG